MIKVECFRCGEIIPEDEAKIFGDEFYCDVCFDDLTYDGRCKDDRQNT